MLVASSLSLRSNREMQDMQSLKSFCEVIQCVKVSLISSLCKLHFHFAFVLRYVPHKNKALWSTTTTVGNWTHWHLTAVIKNIEHDFPGRKSAGSVLRKLDVLLPLIVTLERELTHFFACWSLYRRFLELVCFVRPVRLRRRESCDNTYASQTYVMIAPSRRAFAAVRFSCLLQIRNYKWKVQEVNL